jgi:hypothetical protein
VFFSRWRKRPEGDVDHLHLAQRLRVNGAIPLLPLYIFTAGTRTNWPFTILTYSMEQSPSWEAKTFWATQQIPRILWNPKVHNRIHKSSPPNLISLFHCLGRTKGCLIPRPLCMIRNIINFLRRGVISTSPNLQAGGPPLVGCPRLLIQNIRSYPAYLEAVPPSATWGRAMPWWQHWTHISWLMHLMIIFTMQ